MQLQQDEEYELLEAMWKMQFGKDVEEIRKQ
jgi:hypothetical protein